MRMSPANSSRPWTTAPTPSVRRWRSNGAWRALTTEAALEDMIGAVQAAGYDELLFVGGDPDPRHLDRLEAVVARH